MSCEFNVGNYRGFDIIYSPTMKQFYPESEGLPAGLISPTNSQSELESALDNYIRHSKKVTNPNTILFYDSLDIYEGRMTSFDAEKRIANVIVQNENGKARFSRNNPVENGDKIHCSINMIFIMSDSNKKKYKDIRDIDNKLDTLKNERKSLIASLVHLKIEDIHFKIIKG